MEIKREHQITFWYIIAAIVGVILIQDFFAQQNHIETIPYNEFQQLADQGKVSDLVARPTRVTGTFIESVEGTLEIAVTQGQR